MCPCFTTASSPALLRYHRQTELGSLYLQSPRDFRSLRRRRRVVDGDGERQKNGRVVRRSVPRRVHRLHGAGAADRHDGHQFTTTTQVVRLHTVTACGVPARCPRGAAPGRTVRGCGFFFVISITISSLHGFHAHWNRATMSNMLLLELLVKKNLSNHAQPPGAPGAYIILAFRYAMPTWHNLTSLHDAKLSQAHRWIGIARYAN